MQNQYQELTTDKIKLEAYYEDRLKDIQGQIVMMHDIVDNKQYEVNELLKVRAMLERNLQQVSVCVWQLVYFECIIIVSYILEMV